MNRTVKWIIVALIVLSSPWAYLKCQRTFNVWWQPPKAIEAYLLVRTPLGTSEGAVLEWLHARGVTPDVSKDPIMVSDGLPDQIRGTTRFECSLQRHWFVFSEQVVAFYTFDASGRLVYIRVEKEINSL